MASVVWSVTMRNGRKLTITKRVQGDGFQDIMLVPVQVFESMELNQHVSIKTWQKRVMEVSGHREVTSTIFIVGQLKSHGAVKGKAHTVTLTSLHATMQALNSVGCTKQQISMMTDAIKNGVPCLNGNEVPQPLAAAPGAAVIHVGAPPDVPHAAAAGALITQHAFPAALPELNLTPAQINMHRYGLFTTHSHGLRKVQHEMSMFQEWLMAPVQLNRNGKALDTSSWQNVSSTVSCVLGFAVNIMGQTPCSMSLMTLTNPIMLAQYFSFMVARGTSAQVTKVVCDSKRVLEWVLATKVAPTDVSTKSYLSQMMNQWLPTINKQVPAAIAAKGQATSAEQQHALPSAEQMLIFQRTFVRDARQSQGNYRMLMDATAMSLMFGHTAPPRLSCIYTCIHPAMVGQQGCKDPDCTNAMCRGNRLEWVSEGSTSSQVGNQQLQMVLQHHKTDGTYPAITYKLPAELNELVVEYCTGPAWMEVTRFAAPELQCMMFLTPTNRMYNSSSWGSWWDRLLANARAPFQHFPPSKLRHIFVTEAMGWNGLSSEVVAGAAAIMGHTPNRWQMEYDLNKPQRAVDEANSAIFYWRSAVFAAAGDSNHEAEEAE